MSELKRVHSWFESGKLLRPDYDLPSTVHLARAVAVLCGAPLALDAPSRDLAARIGEHEHYLFVLADGLGMNLVDGLPATALLRRGLAREMRSVFPSSTAPALTSLATGSWPAEHGITGWFVYLTTKRLHATVLPYIERFSGKSLEDSIRLETMFRTRPIAPLFKRDSMNLMPESISHSVYTNFVSDRRGVRGYESLPEAIDMAIDRVRESAEPTFTYLYYSNIDSEEHYHGPCSEEVQAEVALLDRELARLMEAAPGVRLIVSADHGGYEVSESMKFFVEPRSELLETLLGPPAGEPLTPMFQVREGMHSEFETRFRAVCGEHFALLTPQEVEDLRLLGPGPLAGRTRARIGAFLGLSSEGEALVYRPDRGIAAMRGYHGGLSPGEVRIPLILV
jgi:hypothetical protein